MTGHGVATIPIGDQQAIGADFLYNGYNDGDITTADDLEYGDMAARASWGIALGRWMSLGANAKYVHQSTTYNGATAGTGYGFGFDAGAIVETGTLWAPLEGLRLGGVVRDIGGTSLKWDGTDYTEANAYPMSAAVGLSYKPLDNMTLASDVDRTFGDGATGRLHLGAEYVLANILSLRAGWQRDVFGFASDQLFSGGVGLRWRGIQFDYAYETHPKLDPTQYIGLSFAYNPSYVTIKNAHVKPTPVYRAMYRTYEGDPQFAEVTLKNTAQEPLKVQVGLSVPTLMARGERSTRRNTCCRRNRRRGVSLGVTVDDSLLLRETASYDNFVQPEVVVNYEQERETKRTEKKLESLYVLGRNRMTWAEPLRVCSFVTPEHRTVIDFGDRAVREFRGRRDEGVRPVQEPRHRDDPLRRHRPLRRHV